MDFIFKIRILMLVKLLWGHKPISIKWIFRIKKNSREAYQIQSLHGGMRMCTKDWDRLQQHIFSYGKVDHLQIGHNNCCCSRLGVPSHGCQINLPKWEHWTRTLHATTFRICHPRTKKISLQVQQSLIWTQASSKIIDVYLTSQGLDKITQDGNLYQLKN